MTDALNPALDEKEYILKNLLTAMESVLIAFSGGVDSTYLLYMAATVLGREKVLAVTADSPLYPPEETAAARITASSLGIRHVVICTDELSSEDFCTNPPERCYYCKQELFDLLTDLARKHGFKRLLDGSNRDDTADYRPGAKAAKEIGVRSPLQEAGLTKEEIRLLSRRYGLPTWDKPAAACLASRFPYGERLSLDRLRRVEQAERYLRSLGLTREVRVRYHHTIARIEVADSELGKVMENRKAIANYFKQLGFLYITLDLDGFQTGSMNRVLASANQAEEDDRAGQKRDQ
jgi:uncharacterized protein